MMQDSFQFNSPQILLEIYLMCLGDIRKIFSLKTLVFGTKLLLIDAQAICFPYDIYNN
jgi:hypothetical protein